MSDDAHRKGMKMIKLKSYSIDDVTVTLYAKSNAWRVTTRDGSFETTRLFLDYHEASSYFEGNSLGN